VGMSCSSSGGAVSAKRKLNISPACAEGTDSRSQHPAARYHTIASDLLQSRAPQVRFCEGFRTPALALALMQGCRLGPASESGLIANLILRRYRKGHPGVLERSAEPRGC